MNPGTPPYAGAELHRLCRFALALTCGHLVTVDLNGWYPVTVACCDRLGGTTLGGVYVAFSSNVDYVRLIWERYEWRPQASRREGTQVIERLSRTDDPHVHMTGQSAGRFPLWVGSAWEMGRRNS